MSGNQARWEMSSNWRVKTDPRPGQAVKPIHEEQSSRSRALDDDQRIPPKRAAPLRDSTNEKRAIQALHEGRRLWVGDLPRMAKEDDVRALFADNKYEV